MLDWSLPPSTTKSARLSTCSPAGRALWLDPGYGKTTTVPMRSRRSETPGSDMLIVAPLRMVQTVWAQEIEHWASLRGLDA